MGRASSYWRLCVTTLWVTLFGAVLVTLRYLLRTPQPLESVLVGETRLYKWTYGTISFNVAGDEDAPPLVLLHAPEIGSSSYEMRKIVEGLAQQYRVYALDLLGYGLSDRPKLDYSAEIYITQVQDFLRDVVQQPAILLGSGLSGNYSVAIAERTPELCSRIVLLSPMNVVRGKPLRPWFAALIEFPVIGLVTYAALVTSFGLRRVIARQRRIAVQQVTDSELCSISASAHQLGAQHAGLAGLAGKLELDIVKQFETLQQPALLIWGMQALQDAYIPTSAQRASGQVQVSLIADASLHVHEERPAKVVSKILSCHMPAVQSEVSGEDRAIGKPSVWIGEVSGEYEYRAKTLEEAMAIEVSGPGPLPEATEGEEESATTLMENVCIPQVDAIVEEPQSEPIIEGKEAMAEEVVQVEAYCVKCRQKRVMLKAQKVVTKNGRSAMEGTCPVCGTKLFRFIAG